MVLPNITRSLRCTLVASGAVVRVTGLRAPCSQIDKFRKGLRPIVTVRSHGGVKALKAGVMGVVVEAVGSLAMTLLPFFFPTSTSS